MGRMNVMLKFLLFLFFVLPGIVLSQVTEQVAFRNLTVEQGLSQSSVVDIAQDSIGLMWFATQDGLNKYDGRNFTHYDLQFEDVTRPKFSRLGKIYVDQSGGVWAVSDPGKLKKYNRENDKFSMVQNFERVSTLLQANNNDFYLGTYGRGLFKIDAQTKDTVQVLDPVFSKNTIYDFLETDHALWATTANGLFKIKGRGYNFLEIRPGVNFSALAQAEDRTLYLGSYGHGLFLKNPSTKKFTPFRGFASQSLPQDLIIQDVLVDDEDRLWIATYGTGAFLLDFKTKTIQHFTENKNNPYAIQYKDVLSLFQDNTGTIWLGTDGAGLSYYDKYLVKFNLLTNDQAPLSVNLNVIRAITKTGDNIIWVGTSGKGLTRLDMVHRDFFTYTPENSNLLGNRIVSLLADEDKLWIGHQTNGLQVMDAHRQITTFPETAHFTIWKITKSETGALWLCTRRHGLIKFDQNRGIVRSYSKSNSALTTNNIRTLEPCKAGVFWIGTETDGLFRLNTQTHRIENIEAVNAKIKSLYLDKPLLWVGTNGEGLKAYNINTASIRTFSTDEGLPNNVIYGILSDSSGALWLSSNKGITMVKLEDGSISNLVNYTNYDGLQASEFDTGASFKDKNGVLYFGGLEGLNWFKPSQLSFNPIKPKTIISKFEVFGKERKPKPHLKLHSDENTISFHFSSLQFSQPERNQYKYKLVNNDKDWIYAGNTNVAHYTNLPPDDYTFKVVSSNYDGVWNQKATSYAFTILNPWYATVWAEIAYVLLFVLFAYYLYRYFKWRWEIKLQLRLEHKETERLKKMDELKTKLYTNISHEFRTPLTLISGPVENQLAKPEISKSDKKELAVVKQNADRLLNLVNQMLDLSKVESGHQKLKVSQGNLTVLLKQIISAFQYRAEQNRLRVNPHIDDLKNVWFDRDIIEKVVSNLWANAIKYAPAKSRIDFNARKIEGKLLLSIENKTDGPHKKDLDNLFQRFYQKDERSTGIGVGLALVKELVTLSEGTITARETEAGRIQFKVELPIDRTAFAEENLIANETPVSLKPDVHSSDGQAVKDKPHLLIVEDHPEVRSYIRSIFQDHYRIAEAENGKRGIDKALNNLPDLIISDIMMSVQNGIELCKTLKTNELTSHIPIILLTAKVGEESEVKGLETGADAYVTKPFHREKLEIRVEKLIENRRQLQKHFAKSLRITPELNITSTEADFVKRLQEVMNEQLTNPDFKTDEFAALMNMSRTQLHRKLKAVTGMSTSEFVRTERLKLATDRLKNSDAPISEIAYAVGFNSASYFNKCFKGVYHCTPHEYAEKTN